MAAKKIERTGEPASTNLPSKILGKQKSAPEAKKLAGSVLANTHKIQARKAEKVPGAGKMVAKRGRIEGLPNSALSQRIVKAPAKAGSISKKSINAAVKSVNEAMYGEKQKK